MSCDWPNHMAKLAKQSANIVHEMQSLWFFPCLSLPNFNLQPNTQGETKFLFSLSRKKYIRFGDCNKNTGKNYDNK